MALSTPFQEASDSGQHSSWPHEEMCKSSTEDQPDPKSALFIARKPPQRKCPKASHRSHQRFVNGLPQSGKCDPVHNPRQCLSCHSYESSMGLYLNSTSEMQTLKVIVLCRFEVLTCFCKCVEYAQRASTWTLHVPMGKVS